MTVSEKKRLLDTQTIIHYSETGPKGQAEKRKAWACHVSPIPYG